MIHHTSRPGWEAGGGFRGGRRRKRPARTTREATLSTVLYAYIFYSHASMKHVHDTGAQPRYRILLLHSLVLGARGQIGERRLPTNTLVLLCANARRNQQPGLFVRRLFVRLLTSWLSRRAARPGFSAASRGQNCPQTPKGEKFCTTQMQTLSFTSPHIHHLDTYKNRSKLLI